MTTSLVSEFVYFLFCEKIFETTLSVKYPQEQLGPNHKKKNGCQAGLRA